MTALCQQIFALLLLSVFTVAFAAKTESLYDDDDPLWQLDSSNYNKTVLGKKNAWIIEFYSSWCGHCIRFAPTWKQFARETKTWKRIIDVGVVNCNDPVNVELCRRYDVRSYPTLRLFWHHTNASDLGVPYEGNRDIPSLENAIIDFLGSRWEGGVPSDWADIRPLPMQSLQSITDSIPAAKPSTMIFIEYNNSYTGRKVIMDMSFQLNVTIGRVLTTNERLLKDLNFVASNDTVPALIRIFKNNFQRPLFGFSQDVNETDVRDQIFEHLIGTNRSNTKIEDFLPKRDNFTEDSKEGAVYMTDLESALYNSLNQEIGVSYNIQGEKYAALKAYLSVLKRFFPGSPPIMEYLSKLHSWLTYKRHSISGEEFIGTMQQLQSKDEYLPKMKEWVGCKGSQPRYRGYPCSLWTLFHTLTVQADIAQKGPRSDPSDNTGEVLFAIKDYIKYFFTCQDCARNFLDMAHDLERDVLTTQDAVLWLWEHHNQVNERLGGDLTEDPKHPKIQFPSETACSQCRMTHKAAGPEKVAWDRFHVLRFLYKFYSKENILTKNIVESQDSPSANEIPNVGSSAMGIKYFVSPAAALLQLALYNNQYPVFMNGL